MVAHYLLLHLCGWDKRNVSRFVSSPAPSILFVLHGAIKNHKEILSILSPLNMTNELVILSPFKINKLFYFFLYILEKHASVFFSTAYKMWIQLVTFIRMFSFREILSYTLLSAQFIKIPVLKSVVLVEWLIWAKGKLVHDPHVNNTAPISMLAGWIWKDFCNCNNITAVNLEKSSSGCKKK